MPLSAAQQDVLHGFFQRSDFAHAGWVITDLDGTAIQEENGIATIPHSVRNGLKAVYDLGRPIVINSLRFPCSVIRTFGKAWHEISNARIPMINLNGSQLGWLEREDDDNYGYTEIAAFPLDDSEKATVVKTAGEWVAADVREVLVFFYPRSWQKGEIIWTPDPNRVEHVRTKYKSASEVIAGPVEELRKHLSAEEICMVFLLVDLPQDRLMAYQHSRRDNFFTHRGVDKLFGARAMANALKLDLKHALGAGDTPMDTFLKGVGLPVQVGMADLNFVGPGDTLRLKAVSELGEVLFGLASLQRRTQ